MAAAQAVFRASLVENERLNAATRTLSELSEWLQSAKSEPELYQMISTVLGGLMPECTGALYIYADCSHSLSSDKVRVAALSRSFSTRLARNTASARAIRPSSLV